MIDFSANIERIRLRYAVNQSWIVTKTSTVDTVKPWLETGRSSVNHTVSVIVGKNAQTLLKNTEQVNTIVKSALTIVLFTGTYIPNMSNSVQWNNELYSIEAIEEYAPSGVILFYVIRLTR